MEIQSEKRERTFIKLIVGGLFGLILVAFLGYVGLEFFHRWQEGHLIRSAAAYLTGGDTKAAALSARRAFQMNPGNVNALRVLAQIADLERDPAAVDWWRMVINLEPHQTEDLIEFARSSLESQDIATAEKTLNGLDGPTKATARYHAIAARLAEARKNSVEAERHWLKASEIEPNNQLYQLQLASARLGMSKPAERELALQALERLRSEPTERTAATRALILDGLAHPEDIRRVESLAKELQGYPEAKFSDRLLYLDVLRQTRDPIFADYLQGLLQETTTRPSDLAALLSWMSSNEKAAAAIEFAKTIPPDPREKWPVSLALAGAYMTLQDWPGLENLTRAADWSPFNFLRHAYLARSLREQDRKFISEQEWIAAQKEALAQPQSLLMLARTATSWGWNAEKVELLWLLSKNDETKLAALHALYQHYGSVGDTVGLHRTLLRLIEALPNDPALQNNSAQVSLLLDTDVERATKVAADLKAKDPSNGAYVSTYAFALFRKGDVAAALQVMDQLSAEQLRDPPIAVYYGLILAAAGQREKARDYLRHAQEAHLLPEEMALVKKAQNNID